MQSSGPDDTKYCQQCGQQLQAHAQYCDRCGAAQSPPQSNSQNPQQSAGSSPNQPPQQTRQEQPQQPPGHTQPDAEKSDTSLTRRQTLGGLAIGGVVGVGGLALLTNDDLTSSSSSHSYVQEAAWSRQQEIAQSGWDGIQGRVTLSSGEFTGWSFWTENAEAGWFIEDVQGGSVDVHLIAADEQETYAKGGDVRIYSYLTENNIRSKTEREQTPPPNDYVLMLNNSDVYGSSADETVEFDVIMGVRTL